MLKITVKLIWVHIRSQKMMMLKMAALEQKMKLCRWFYHRQSFIFSKFHLRQKLWPNQMVNLLIAFFWLDKKQSIMHFHWIAFDKFGHAQLTKVHCKCGYVHWTRNFDAEQSIGMNLNEFLCVFYPYLKNQISKWKTLLCSVCQYFSLILNGFRFRKRTTRP